MARENQVEILARALKKLKAANRRVSIRSLARSMSISHVYLTKILKGEKSVSIQILPALSDILRLDEFDRAALRVLIVERKVGKLADSPTAETSPNFTGYVDLPVAQFRFFSNPWSFAALDLLTCDFPFKLTRSSLSAILGIKALELNRFLDAMIEIGVVEESRRILRKTRLNLRIPTSGPNEHTRKLYREIAMLTREELRKTSKEDFERRLVLGYSCAVNPKKVNEAKQILAAAVKQCAETLAQGDCTDVFWVQGQMFSLLNTRTKR